MCETLSKLFEQISNTLKSRVNSWGILGSIINWPVQAEYQTN